MHHCSELDGGEVISSWDSPARIDSISTGVASAGQFRAPTKDPLPALSVLHTAEYLSFLEVAHSKWLEAGSGSECAMASVFPADRRSESIPRTIEGQLGYFSFANDCSIGAATWSAALSSASVAASAAAALSVDHEPHEEQRATFALCRPPGHHAMRDRFGGYCYLNNAAVAAQTLLDKDSVRRVFVLGSFHKCSFQLTRSPEQTQQTCLLMSITRVRQHSSPGDMDLLALCGRTP